MVDHCFIVTTIYDSLAYLSHPIGSILRSPVRIAARRDGYLNLSDVLAIVAPISILSFCAPCIRSIRFVVSQVGLRYLGALSTTWVQWIHFEEII